MYSGPAATVGTVFGILSGYHHYCTSEVTGPVKCHTLYSRWADLTKNGETNMFPTKCVILDFSLL